jgi:transcriptional regulator with XRE-family HTH domain
MKLGHKEKLLAERLGKEVKRKRLEKRLSQADLAALLGLKTRLSVINIEAGNSFPTAKVLVEIEDKLGVQIIFSDNSEK